MAQDRRDAVSLTFPLDHGLCRHGIGPLPRVAPAHAAVKLRRDAARGMLRPEHRTMHSPLARLVLILSLPLLAACAAQTEARVAKLVPLDATPAAFEVCHGSGCRTRTPVSLTAAQWDEVRALFAATQNAPEERAAISKSVALIERLVAKPAGTGKDVGRNLVTANQGGQLDCVDEAVNSTTYLRMMAQDDLIRFHDVGFPAHRGGIIRAHNTAVIRDRATGERYAVDSWFYDNGMPPAVVALQTWRDGWQPGDSPDAIAQQSAERALTTDCRCTKPPSGGIKTITP